MQDEVRHRVGVEVVVLRTAPRCAIRAGRAAVLERQVPLVAEAELEQARVVLAAGRGDRFARGVLVHEPRVVEAGLVFVVLPAAGAAASLRGRAERTGSIRVRLASRVSRQCTPVYGPVTQGMVSAMLPACAACSGWDNTARTSTPECRTRPARSAAARRKASGKWSRSEKCWVNSYSRTFSSKIGLLHPEEVGLQAFSGQQAIATSIPGIVADEVPAQVAAFEVERAARPGARRRTPARTGGIAERPSPFCSHRNRSLVGELVPQKVEHLSRILDLALLVVELVEAPGRGGDARRGSAARSARFRWAASGPGASTRPTAAAIGPASCRAKPSGTGFVPRRSSCPAAIVLEHAGELRAERHLRVGAGEISPRNRSGSQLHELALRPA